MAKKAKNKNITSDGFSYLDKRVLVSRARSAGKKAAARAMEVMGYTVVVVDNSVVRKYADGSIDVLEPLAN